MGGLVRLPSMMTVTSRVIIIICWLALMLLAVEYPRDHWIFRTAVLAVIGVVLLAEWWRWKQKVNDTIVAPVAIWHLGNATLAIGPITDVRQMLRGR